MKAMPQRRAGSRTKGKRGQAMTGKRRMARSGRRLEARQGMGVRASRMSSWLSNIAISRLSKRGARRVTSRQPNSCCRRGRKQKNGCRRKRFRHEIRATARQCLCLKQRLFLMRHLCSKHHQECLRCVKMLLFVSVCAEILSVPVLTGVTRGSLH